MDLEVQNLGVVAYLLRFHHTYQGPNRGSHTSQAVLYHLQYPLVFILFLFLLLNFPLH